MNKVNTQGAGLRHSINEIAEKLINELQQETLSPMEKLAFLKAILPYAVGKLPNATLNYDYCSGQPTSARIIEPSPNGGKEPKKNWEELADEL